MWCACGSAAICICKLFWAFYAVKAPSYVARGFCMEKTLFTMGFGSMWNCIAGVEELVTIASCVGGCGLAAVCKLLAEDFSGWAGVLPIHACVCVCVCVCV